MNLQREDIHPLQDTCPYFQSLDVAVGGDFFSKIASMSSIYVNMNCSMSFMAAL
jgi:hypothetical protein